MGFNWNEAAIMRLRALFILGMSDKNMALTLGAEFPELGQLTRSSIIGKRHRLDLQVDALVVRSRQQEAARVFNQSMGGRRPGSGRKKGVSMPHLRKPENRPPEPKLPRTLPAVVHNISMNAQQGVAVRNFSLDIPDFACEPVALLDLEPHHCRWPMDQGGFCGNRKLEGEWFPYCAHHVRLGQRRDGRTVGHVR